MTGDGVDFLRTTESQGRQEKEDAEEDKGAEGQGDREE